MVDSNPSIFTIHEEQLVLKYRAEIREVGPMVPEFITEGILIFFGETAPTELREVSLVHNGTQLLSHLNVGDFLKFIPPSSDGGEVQPPSWYRLTAVGTMANANCAELGHLVVHFDASPTAHLPGTISVEPVLTTPLEIGTTFELLGPEEK